MARLVNLESEEEKKKERIFDKESMKEEEKERSNSCRPSPIRWRGGRFSRSRS